MQATVLLAFAAFVILVIVGLVYLFRPNHGLGVPWDDGVYTPPVVTAPPVFEETTIRIVSEPVAEPKAPRKPRAVKTEAVVPKPPHRTAKRTPRAVKTSAVDDAPVTANSSFDATIPIIATAAIFSSIDTPAQSYDSSPSSSYDSSASSSDSGGSSGDSGGGDSGGGGW